MRHWNNTAAHDMKGDVVREETPYGFKYGAATIERIHAKDSGDVWISIKTNREVVQIHITPSGLVREASRVKP